MASSGADVFHEVEGFFSPDGLKREAQVWCVTKEGTTLKVAHNH